MSSIGERIRAARQRAGLTQKQVAHATGLGITQISDIERGRYRKMGPDTATIQKLARAIPNADVAEFLTEPRQPITDTPPYVIDEVSVRDDIDSEQGEGPDKTLLRAGNEERITFGRGQHSTTSAVGVEHGGHPGLHAELAALLDAFRDRLAFLDELSHRLDATVGRVNDLGAALVDLSTTVAAAQDREQALSVDELAGKPRAARAARGQTTGTTRKTARRR